jgi:hypothetical protein
LNGFPGKRSYPRIDYKPCGRAMQDREVRRPNCECTHQSFWKQAVVIAAGVAVTLGTIGLAIISRGKVPPKS